MFIVNLSLAGICKLLDLGFTMSQSDVVSDWKWWVYELSQGLSLYSLGEGIRKGLCMLQYPLRHWLTQKPSLMRFGHERLEGNWARHVEDDVPGLLTSSCISLKRLPHPDTTCAWMKLSRNEYVLLTFKPNQVSWLWKRQLPMSIIQQQGGPVYNTAINRELQSIIQPQGAPVYNRATGWPSLTGGQLTHMDVGTVWGVCVILSPCVWQHCLLPAEAVTYLDYGPGWLSACVAKTVMLC